jgi:hypothetical protein
VSVRSCSGYEKTFSDISNLVHLVYPGTLISQLQDLAHQNLLLITAGTGQLRYKFCFRSFKPTERTATFGREICIVSGHSRRSNTLAEAGDGIYKEDYKN